MTYSILDTLQRVFIDLEEKGITERGSVLCPHRDDNEHLRSSSGPMGDWTTTPLVYLGWRLRFCQQCFKDTVAEFEALNIDWPKEAVLGMAKIRARRRESA